MPLSETRGHGATRNRASTVDGSASAVAEVWVAPAPRRVGRRSPFRALLSGTPIGTLLPIVAVLTLWEMASDLNLIDVTFFPAPHTIAIATWTLALSGEISQNLMITLERILAGFVIGATPAILLGLLMGRIGLFRAVFDPLIAVTYPIPHIAILPLLLVIFGLGSAPIIALAAIVCFYPAVVNTYTGVRGADERLVRMARNMGANERQILWKIVLPDALPSVFAGLRLSIGLALLSTVAGEFVASSTGIGAQTWLYWQVYQIQNMYGTLVVVVALGFTLSVLMQFGQRRFFGWATATEEVK